MASRLQGVERIVASGDAAPGTTGSFQHFRHVVSEAAAGVAFFASLDAGQDAGVWRWDGEALQFVACTCAAPPDVGTDTFESITESSLRLDESGLSFHAFVEPGRGTQNANDACIFASDAGGDLALRARDGDLAPDLPDERMLVSSAAASDSLVAVAVYPAAGSPAIDSLRGALYRLDPIGGLGRIPREGATTPAESTFCQIGSPVIDALDGVSFIASDAPTLGGDCSEPANWQWGLFEADPGGAIRTRFRAGDPAPGGGTFRDGSVLARNAFGEVAFSARLAIGGGIHAGNDSLIWGPDGAGGVRPVAREGSPAPGANGVAFGSLYAIPQLVLDASGWTSFYAPLADGSAGIWTSAPTSSPILVARTGVPSIAFPGETVSVVNIDGVVSGGLVFRTLAAGAGTAVWTIDFRTTQRDLLLRTGDPVPLEPSDERVVETAVFTSEAPAGSIAARLAFEDDSEAIVRFALPELDGGSAYALASLSLMILRARRPASRGAR